MKKHPDTPLQEWKKSEQARTGDVRRGLKTWKICPKCETAKLTKESDGRENFYQDNHATDGWGSTCKECRLALASVRRHPRDGTRDGTGTDTRDVARGGKE